MTNIETTDYTITVKVPVDNHLGLVDHKCSMVQKHAATRGGILQKMCNNTLNEKKEKSIIFTFLFKDFEKFIEFKYTVEHIVGE